MKADLSPDKITRATFDEVLARYDELIRDLSSGSGTSKEVASAARQSLQELDQWRLTELPATLQKRTQANDDAWLEKSEVEDLIKWKLKHGKFRPRLMQLVSSNKPDDITRVTSEAFKTYSSSAQVPGPALSILCSLSGIGPASASLLLSIYDPDRVPFFSDECFRWMMLEEGKGKGWDRNIKYDAKTYQSYFEKVQALKERLSGDDDDDEVRATDVERVGFILGKEAELGRQGGTKEKVPAKKASKRTEADANLQDIVAPAGKRAKRESRKKD